VHKRGKNERNQHLTLPRVLEPSRGDRRATQRCEARGRELPGLLRKETRAIPSEKKKEKYSNTCFSLLLQGGGKQGGGQREKKKCLQALSLAFGSNSGMCNGRTQQIHPFVAGFTYPFFLVVPLHLVVTNWRQYKCFSFPSYLNKQRYSLIHISGCLKRKRETEERDQKCRASKPLSILKLMEGLNSEGREEKARNQEKEDRKEERERKNRE